MITHSCLGFSETEDSDLYEEDRIINDKKFMYHALGKFIIS